MRSLLVASTFSWLFCAVFLFVEEGLQEYLLRFRYRELREALNKKRKRRLHLFRLVNDRNRYIRIFKTLPVVFAVVLGMSLSVLAWVLFSWVDLGQFKGGLFLQAFLLVVVLAVQLILTHRVPKLICVHYPIFYLNGSALFLMGVEYLCRPFLRLVELVPQLPSAFLNQEEITFDEIDSDLQILALAEESVTITPITEKIALRSLDLSEISVYDILLPRNQVQIFDVNDGVQVNLEKARKTGHTRFPLCVDDLDHCSGIIHIKDIFRANLPLEEVKFDEIARPMLKVDQEDPLDRVLQLLLKKRIHMALVEDEFGGILGVLTLERILEELVGEIQDEFDKEEKMIVNLGNGFYRISGLAPIHEVEDQLGIENLENDEVSSFGGLISHYLGRIPASGEVVAIGSLRVTILETVETRVVLTKVRIVEEVIGQVE